MNSKNQHVHMHFTSRDPLSFRHAHSKRHTAHTRLAAMALDSSGSSFTTGSPERSLTNSTSETSSSLSFTVLASARAAGSCSISRIKSLIFTSWSWIFSSYMRFFLRRSIRSCTRRIRFSSFSFRVEFRLLHNTSDSLPPIFFSSFSMRGDRRPRNPRVWSRLFFAASSFFFRTVNLRLRRSATIFAFMLSTISRVSISLFTSKVSTVCIFRLFCATRRLRICVNRMNWGIMRKHTFVNFNVAHNTCQSGAIMRRMPFRVFGQRIHGQRLATATTSRPEARISHYFCWRVRNILGGPYTTLSSA